jgi:hypothetical protein
MMTRRPLSAVVQRFTQQQPRFLGRRRHLGHPRCIDQAIDRGVVQLERDVIVTRRVEVGDSDRVF